MSKTTKIVIAVVVLIIIALAIYFFFFRSSGNQYASAATLKAINSGSFGKFVEWPSNAAAVDLELAKIDNSLVWDGADPSWKKGNIYGAAWLKGMDIAYSVDNVNKFNGDIARYVKNEKLRKPHWEVTKGSFRTT